MKLLLVEHSKDLRDTAAAALRRAGFVVEALADGAAGLWAAHQLDPDVIVIELAPTGFDGVMLLRRLRAEGLATPVLMLTATLDVEARLHCFDAGADDCMPQPVDLRELAARARALAFRARATPCDVATLGDLRIDRARGEVCRDGRPVPMRRRERLLLEVLFAQQGRLVSRAKIESKLYGDCTDLQSNSVEAAVSQLRRWIDTPGGPSRITTLRGEGYRLER
ncbi:MAG: response regulator transcription factor [Burkholderiaceae bacterium]